MEEGGVMGGRRMVAVDGEVVEGRVGGVEGMMEGELEGRKEGGREGRIKDSKRVLLREEKRR